MTDREKAIVMAYTGYCMLAGDKLKVFYDYVGELFGRPVYTHEFADPDIQEKASNDFYKLCRETTPEDVDDLQKEADYWHKMSQSYEHTICKLVQAIAQNREKQWIPCSERLPEFKQEIFFTEKNNKTEELYVGRGMFCGVIARTGNGSNPWDYADTFSVSERRWHVLDSKIVAWLPVPLPWKEEKEEGEPIPHWRGQMDGCLPFQTEEEDEQVH